MLAAYAQAIPLLQAEEQLERVLVGQIAAGVAKPSNARQALSEMQRAADRGRPRKAADPRRLRAAGIRVETHRTTRSTTTSEEG